eukprot:3194169-Amphidinium_carterae.1
MDGNIRRSLKEAAHSHPMFHVVVLGNDMKLLPKDVKHVQEVVTNYIVENMRAVETEIETELVDKVPDPQAIRHAMMSSTNMDML